MNPTNQSLIHLEGIKKVFMTDEVETHALADVHLDINKGEFVSIAGPSGCGKSTLLSILGLLDSPTDGTYVLNGHSVANLGAAERARIRNREVGFIFQSFNLIGDLTVFENDQNGTSRPGQRGGPGFLSHPQPFLCCQSGSFRIEAPEGVTKQYQG